MMLSKKNSFISSIIHGKSLSEGKSGQNDTPLASKRVKRSQLSYQSFKPTKTDKRRIQKTLAN